MGGRIKMKVKRHNNIKESEVEDSFSSGSYFSGGGSHEYERERFFFEHRNSE